MVLFKGHGVYRKVPVANAIEMAGKQPIGVRWIDRNKSDEATPDYRSRLVAKERRRNSLDEMFAATPPLEAKNTS